MTSAADASTYPLKRVQELLGISRAAIDALIAAGFVAPTRGRRNELRFTFQDLMLMRMAHGLQDARVPTRKIIRALAQLRAALPASLPITGLRIGASGNEVAVQDRDGRWEVASGQLLIDFEVARDEGSITFLPASSSGPVDDADACFARGQALESSDPRAAEAAYRTAVERAPAHADAWLNLGALLCDQQRFGEAIALLDRALVHCPEVALLHYNRAVALDDAGRSAEASNSYERSLALDPSLADAHYNLGRLRESLGDGRGALRHFAAYRRLSRR